VRIKLVDLMQVFPYSTGTPTEALQLEKVNTMKKSYVNEHSMSVKIDIDLGELNHIITIVKGAVEAEADTPVGNHYRENSRLLSSLRTVRREMALEAVREFTSITELGE